MKKVFSVFIAVVLMVMCICCVGVAEEADEIDFSLVEELGLSASSWFEDRYTRALLTIIVARLASEEDSGTGLDVDDFVNTSYVGYDGESVLMIAYVTSGEKAFYVLYAPGEQMARYGFFSQNDEDGIEFLMDELGMEYKMNSKSAMTEVLELLIERS